MDYGDVIDRVGTQLEPELCKEFLEMISHFAKSEETLDKLENYINNRIKAEASFFEGSRYYREILSRIEEFKK